MPNLARAGYGLLLLFVLGMTLAACGGSTEPEYAGDITENILTAINDDNYAQYSEFFTAEMKEKMTEVAVGQLNSSFRLEIGNYESKEFWKTEKAGQYTSVFYKARFSKEPDDVIVKVVFQKLEGQVYVAGLWFDSPKLRGA